MKTLYIDSSSTHGIQIGYDLLSGTWISEYCKHHHKRPAVITDNHLANTLGKALQNTLHQQELSAEIFSFPAGERYKTRETKQQLEDALLSHQYNRDTCLIALGGGIVTDLTGFIAATYCRSVPVIYCPTTLLAMVDASIGGKTGVNTPHGKNLIGAFSQPAAVLIDLKTLETLPASEWRNGMAEIVKHALIASPALLEKLTHIKISATHDLAEIIHESCLIKNIVVKQDEKEKNKRHILNFGHTIGHAVEKITNYTIKHGEAVAIGMLVESYLSYKIGQLSQKDFEMIQKTLHDKKFILKTNAFNNISTFKKILIYDKKSLKQVPHFVLLKQIGQVYQEKNQYTFPVDSLILDRVLEWAKNYFSQKKQPC